MHHKWGTAFEWRGRPCGAGALAREKLSHTFTALVPVSRSPACLTASSSSRSLSSHPRRSLFPGVDSDLRESRPDLYADEGTRISEHFRQLPGGTTTSRTEAVAAAPRAPFRTPSQLRI